MNRQRKIDEQAWEDDDEALSADHVVERFFSQHERDADEAGHRLHPPGRARRRGVPPPEADD